MSLDFIKRYAPNISKEAEGVINEYTKTNDSMKAYARITKNKNHIDKLLREGDVRVRQALFDNYNITPDHINLGLTDKNPIIRFAAISNQNATAENVDRAMNDSNWPIRVKAMMGFNVIDRHFDKAIIDSHPRVRKIPAVYYKNISKPQLLTLLNDSDSTVSFAAKNNPRYREYFPNGHE